MIRFCSILLSKKMTSIKIRCILLLSSLLQGFGEPYYFLFPIQRFGLNVRVCYSFVDLIFKFTLLEFKNKFICSSAISRRTWKEGEMTGKSCGKGKQWSYTPCFISYFSLLRLHDLFLSPNIFQVPSRPSWIHTSILPASCMRCTGTSPWIVCQCHKACPLCLLPRWPALAGCSEMPTLITNFTF